MDRYISIPSILFEEMTGFISDVLPGCGPNRKVDAERILTAINSVKTAQNQVDATGLKKCPFCGGNARKEVYSDDIDVVESTVRCIDCGACVAHEGKLEDAVFAWNRRVL